MPHCSECGNEVSETAKFCSECGKRLKDGDGEETSVDLSDNVMNRSQVDASSASARPSIDGGINVTVGNSESGRAHEQAEKEFCAVCGKLLEHPYRRCPECGQLVCEEHFAEDELMCLRCRQSGCAEQEAGTRAATVTDLPGEEDADSIENPWERPGNEAGEETTGPDGGTLVWVPGGSFEMGSEDGEQYEGPVHKVTVHGFWIGQCPVTNEQYVAFLNEADPDDVDEWLLLDAGIELAGGRYHPQPGLGRHPVKWVNWYGAQAYCEHYDLQLLTEAQWEYAARGLESRIYPWGDTWDERKCLNKANCKKIWESESPTMEVGSFCEGASWCGALDMAGNVSEWCADWFDEDYYSDAPSKNPTGPSSGSMRVFRSASYLSDAEANRCFTRPAFPPSWMEEFLGFRIAANSFEVAES